MKFDDEQRLRISVMGAGGLGGYYGGVLAKAGEEVTLIARGEHLRAIRENGLHVRSVIGDFTANAKATDEPEEVGSTDLVLFCVKTYDTEEAAEKVKPIVDRNTTVLTIQNGVDNHQKIGRIVGLDRVLPGAAYLASGLVAPGVVAQTAGPRKIVFGEVNGSVTERVKNIQAVFVKAGVPCEASTNVMKSLWEKFAFICVFTGVNCCTRLPMGDIMACQETKEIFRRAIEEVCQIARAEGVALDRDYVERMMRFAENLEKGAITSMYRDLTQNRPLEVDALQGIVVKLARKNNIPTPVNEVLFSIIKAHDIRAG